MSEEIIRALRNAAASSAMENLALNEEHLATIGKILAGEMTLTDFFHSIQMKPQEN